MFTHYEDTKGNAKCRNWGVLGITGPQSHWQHNHLIEHIRLSIQRQKWLCLTYPTYVWHRCMGLSRSNFAVIFGIRALQSPGYCVALFT